MITVGKNKFFTSDDFTTRAELVQRAIDLLTDTEKFEQFSQEMSTFLDTFENNHGTNPNVKTHGIDRHLTDAIR